MEPEGSLPCSQQPSTRPYPEPGRSSPYKSHPISLRSILILSTHLPHTLKKQNKKQFFHVDTYDLLSLNAVKFGRSPLTFRGTYLQRRIVSQTGGKVDLCLPPDYCWSLFWLTRRPEG
jgi:hypothetical protein